VSLAGRTQNPLALPLPCRIGGFGGAEGLARMLRDERIDAVVDATHPFAARIGANAAKACKTLGLPLARYTRPPWLPQPGDRWQSVPDIFAAAQAIGETPVRVFLTTGRLGLAAFKNAPQHDYVIRTIDPPEAGDLPPQNRILLARGPFSLEAETALMAEERIAVLVTKNSGGAASAPKLAAARRLGLPVIMVEPPHRPDATAFHALEDILGWIAAVQRGAP
jgi:precorrin-6A/cobalt-precorrin-6A reductase